VDVWDRSRRLGPKGAPREEKGHITHPEGPGALAMRMRDFGNRVQTPRAGNLPFIRLCRQSAARNAKRARLGSNEKPHSSKGRNGQEWLDVGKVFAISSMIVRKFRRATLKGPGAFGRHRSRRLRG